jgi:hypothetical protein
MQYDTEMPLNSSRQLANGTRERLRRRQRIKQPTIEQLEVRVTLSGTGTWTPLANLMPGSGSGTGNMMLLSNGTVMIQGGGDSVTNNAKWYALTPDSQGNYVDGTWSQLASMKLKRLDYASVVLPDGDVMVLGAEYSGPTLAKNYTSETEIYDPVSNTWKVTARVPESKYGDQPVEVLPNGTVLTPSGNNTTTYIYSPVTNSWSTGPSKLNGDTSYEENWAKLPAGEIMSVTTAGSRLRVPQVFLPSSTQWAATASLPAVLSYAPSGYILEMGPGVMLPGGRFWQIGGNDLTAIYVLPRNTGSAGRWMAGPSIPQPLSNKLLTGADVAAAVLPSGQVLFTASPWLAKPTSVYLFNPKANNGNGSITAISPPVRNGTAGQSINKPGWYSYFLDLPNGQILYDQRSDSQLWLYTPSGAPVNSWRPTVSSVSLVRGNIYTVSGTQFNGMSEGAYYGDDAEMSTNFPIVTLTAQNGTVYFARILNWSNTGVQTGSARVTTRMILPSGLRMGTYSLRVIANGIASAPYTIHIRKT